MLYPFRQTVAAMESLLDSDQKKRYQEFKEFVAAQVEPFAERWDREQQHPTSIISALGQAGYLGSTVPVAYGGKGWDFVTFGLLNEAFGYGSSALTDLLTVQAMVSMTLLKWGADEQKKKWLPPLANGQTIAAFALTEPGTGSALQSLQTTFRGTEGRDHLILNGTKQWISYGQLAQVFLVFGKLDEKFVACLVQRESAGVEIEPIREMLGFRAAGLARIKFHEVEISSRRNWQSRFRFVPHCAGRPSIWKNQHCLLGLGTPKKLFQREYFSCCYSQGRKSMRGRYWNDPVVAGKDGDRPGSGALPLLCRLPGRRSALAGSFRQNSSRKILHLDRGGESGLQRRANSRSFRLS